MISNQSLNTEQFFYASNPRPNSEPIYVLFYKERTVWRFRALAAQTRVPLRTSIIVCATQHENECYLIAVETCCRRYIHDNCPHNPRAILATRLDAPLSLLSCVGLHTAESDPSHSVCHVKLARVKQHLQRPVTWIYAQGRLLCLQRFLSLNA